MVFTACLVSKLRLHSSSASLHSGDDSGPELGVYIEGQSGWFRSHTDSINYKNESHNASGIYSLQVLVNASGRF